MATKKKSVKKAAKPVAKPAHKKVAKVKVVAKKTAPSKAKPAALARKKIPVKRAPGKKAVSGARKPVAAAKPVVKKPALARPGLTPLRPVVMPAQAKGPKPKPLSAKDLAFYRDLLLKLRDRIIDEISFLSRDNLNRSQKESSGDLSSHSFHMADQGTDNFDREFAASLLSSEQDVLYEIDEAIRRVDAGTYGVCEATGEPIERERLKVLPFARYCVAAQAEMERGKPRFRPFRRTSIQSLEPQQ